MAGWSSQSFVVPGTPLTTMSSTPNFHGHPPSRKNDVVQEIIPETPSPGKLCISDREFCTAETLLNSLAYINQDLELLGLSCIPVTSRQPSDLDPLFLINRLHDVLTLYHKTQVIKDELDVRNHRLSCDLQHHQAMYKRLKRSKESVEREAQQDRERLRQLNSKYKTMSGQIKADEEEVRKLTAMQGSRDVQYKHEQKKKEKELNKLKERLHQLISDKAPDRKVGMDIMSLVGGSDGRRATWKTAPVKQEEEMYQVLVSNYEEGRQELMQENSELRDCLLSLQRELSTLLKRTGDISASSVMELSSNNNQSNSLMGQDDYGNDEENDFLRSSRLSITDLEDGYFQMPCDVMRHEIQQMFKDTCDQISHSMKKSLTRNINKVSTSSSASSYRRKSQTSFPTSCDASVPDRPVGAERRTPSVSEVTEIERLKKQISNYKSIIEQQEDLIQQTLSSHSASMESSFVHESQLLKDKENLAEQRKLFTEERANFDKERKTFTEAAIRLAKEKKVFDAEKATMLKQQFLNLSPFKGSNRRTGKTADGSTNRLLPATPVFSPAKNGHGQATTISTTTDDHSHLPTTVQLFKALGLSKHPARDDYSVPDPLFSPAVTTTTPSPTTTLAAATFTPSSSYHRQVLMDSHSSSTSKGHPHHHHPQDTLSPDFFVAATPSPSATADDHIIGTSSTTTTTSDNSNSANSPRLDLIKASLMRKHLERSKSKD